MNTDTVQAIIDAAEALADAAEQDVHCDACGCMCEAFPDEARRLRNALLDHETAERIREATAARDVAELKRARVELVSTDEAGVPVYGIIGSPQKVRV